MSAASSVAPKRRRWTSLTAALFVLAAIAAGGIYTDYLRPLPDPTKMVKGWQWLFTPLERNAFMRMPVITGELRGMEVSRDGQTIVLVGAEDLLLTSPDAGRSWIRGSVVSGEPNPPKGAFNLGFGLTGTAFAAPPDRTAEPEQKRAKPAELPPSKKPTATSAARPPVTRRGSAEQAQQKSDDTRQPPIAELVADTSMASELAKPKRALTAVSLVDDRTFVAVGTVGLIMRTSDAGNTWSVRPSTTLEQLHSVACSREVCLAVGANGALIRSGDSGETWRSAASGSTEELDKIAQLDAGRWLATRADGRLLKLDANAQVLGTIELSDFPARDGPLHLVIQRDHKRGMVTMGRRVWVSEDAESWKPVPSSEHFFSTLAFDARGRAHATELVSHKVYYTDDLAKTWRLESDHGRDSGVNVVVEFYSSLASTESGELYWLINNALRRRSAQGRWSVLTWPANQFSALQMLGTRGLVVGRYGTVLSSDDAGETWEPRESGTTEDLTHLAIGDTQHAFAASDSAGSLIRTSDGGQSWTRTPTPQAFPAAFLVALDAEHLFIIRRDRSSALETKDGGRSWTPRSDIRGELGFADAQHGLQATRRILPVDEDRSGVPTHDAISETNDGGRSWRPLGTGSVIWIDRYGRTSYAVFAADGLTQTPSSGSIQLVGNALAMLQTARDTTFNEHGVGLAIESNSDGLLRITESGKTWARPANPANSRLEGVHFADDKRVVVLAQGRIATSDDAGETFRPVTYRRYPSPWLWFASLLLVITALAYARSSINEPAVSIGPASIADAAASDRPLKWWDPDHAGLRDIARGLSRFLRNRKTDPPLTIAVTGEWGTGKSSLMNLLQHDLERYGYRPVWFNAWHHQSGENLLGSLLANIHAQGVPAFMSLAGLDFRMSLTALRIRRFWLRASITLLLFAVVAFSYSVLEDKWFSFWTTLTKTSETGLSTFGAAGGLLGIALSVATPFLGVARVASAFGLQPGKLIAAVANTGSDESARHQAGARYRFAREFEDFTRALEPRPLVVFIDDLDRCRAPNVVETLEAVNFLVTSGRCIVVLGMARHWVETCVGLAFKELAEAHVQSSSGTPDQQQFARHYLEKLINIEIRVPQLSDAAATAILRGNHPDEPHQSWRFTLGSALLGGWRWAQLIAAFVPVLFIAYVIAQSLSHSAAPHTAEQKPIEQSAAFAPNLPASPDKSGPTSQTNETSQARVELSRAQVSAAWYWSCGAVAFLGVLALAALALFARREARTEDSPDFREALRILQPFILLGGTSPRSLKRFINQLRYLAMRSRLTPEDPTAYERLTRRIRRFFGRSTPEASSFAPSPRAAELTEELLVSLAALHRCGDGWLNTLFLSDATTAMQPFLQQELTRRLPDAHQRDAVLEKLLHAVDELNMRFTRSRLFADPTLDSRRARAFITLLALDTSAQAEPQFTAEQTHTADTSVGQIY